MRGWGGVVGEGRKSGIRGPLSIVGPAGLLLDRAARRQGAATRELIGVWLRKPLIVQCCPAVGVQRLMLDRTARGQGAAIRGSLIGLWPHKSVSGWIV